MKRIFSFVLCMAFLFSLASCSDVAENFEKEKIVAVKYAYSDKKASEAYINQGYTRVTYNSTSDVVLAVENGKADYGVLDEFQLNSYILNQRKIKAKEQCEYSIDYCAYFSAENEELQASFDEAISCLNGEGVLDEVQKDHLNGKSFSSYVENNENGTLTMLCDPSFENRVYADDNGEIVGLDIDIAREICNYLGYDLDIVTADFDELFIMLQNGEGDFIMSACEVNEDRAESFLLSDTYYTLNYYLIEKE